MLTESLSGLQEKDTAVNELKRLQSSVRATQMVEVTKENRVLLDEVGRLREMNAVLKQQLVAREETYAEEVSSLKMQLQQLKRERKACACHADKHGAWAHYGWGYDEQSTAKQLLNRSRYAYDAIFHALKFCGDSSASAILGSPNINSNPVEVQIRALMDFLSQQGSR